MYKKKLMDDIRASIFSIESRGIIAETVFRDPLCKFKMHIHSSPIA